MAKMAKSSKTLVKEAHDRLDAAWTHDQENRDDAYKDLKMAAGDQWPSGVKSSREAAGRPCLTLNRMTQFIHQVANDIRTNPPGIRVTPVDDKNDPELAKIYSGLIRDIEYRSDASSIYAAAGSHAVICGIGHFRVTTQYAHDETFDQEIVLQRIPHPLSVYWDPDAILPDRSDAQWCIVTELIHKKTFEDRYPKITVTEFGVPSSTSTPESGLYWHSADMIRIAEYWRKVPAKKRIAQIDSGEVIDITGFSKVQLGQLAIVKERDVDGYAVESVLLTDKDLLGDTQKWAGRFIPIIPVMGGEIPLETKTVRYGLVRYARDAQQLYNYARSAAAESIGLAPKAPYVATAKQIGKYKAQWDNHNTTQRPYLLYEPDERVPGGKPVRENPPDIPAAFVQEAQIAVEDMKATTGIYDASLGARSNETSGRAIIARERQGDTSTAHFSANLNASIRHCGRILLDLIPKIYDTPRVVRILGDDGESENFVPINRPIYSNDGVPVLLNDLNQGRYDVRLRTGPNYATKRLEAADSMLQFVQAVPAAAQIIGDLIAKNMDWPGADEIAARLKRAIPATVLGPDNIDADDPEAQKQAQQAAQQAAKMQQMQDLAAKLELTLKEANVAKTRAEARKSSALAQTEQLNALIAALTNGLQMPPDGFAEDEEKAQQAFGADATAGMPDMGEPEQMQPPQQQSDAPTEMDATALMGQAGMPPPQNDF